MNILSNLNLVISRISGLFNKTFPVGIWLFTIFLTMQFLTSCQNEDFDKTKKTNTNLPENPHAKFLMKWNIKNQILPRTDRYSVSEALDYLNDGMNYIYCRPNDYYLESLVFVDTFSVPVSSGEIDEEDLIDLMDDIALFAGDNYYADERTEKEPLIFNMTNIGSPSPSYANIEATFVMEAGVPISTTDGYPYSDSWIYGQFNTDVSDQCSDEELNFDAVDLLERDLRANVSYRNKLEHYTFENPYGICFNAAKPTCVFQTELCPFFPITEEYCCSELANEDDNVPNFYDYLLFKNDYTLSNYHECLEDNEMNYYYESMADLATGGIPYPHDDTEIIQFELGYSRGLEFGHLLIWHAMEVVMAHKLEITDSDDYIALALPCCE